MGVWVGVKLLGVLCLLGHQRAVSLNYNEDFILYINCIILLAPTLHTGDGRPARAPVCSQYDFALKNDFPDRAHTHTGSGRPACAPACHYTSVW